MLEASEVDGTGADLLVAVVADLVLVAGADLLVAVDGRGAARADGSRGAALLVALDGRGAARADGSRGAALLVALDGRGADAWVDSFWILAGDGNGPGDIGSVNGWCDCDNTGYPVYEGGEVFSEDGQVLFISRSELSSLAIDGGEGGSRTLRLMVFRPIVHLLALAAFVSITTMLLNQMALTLKTFFKLKICTYAALVHADILEIKGEMDE
ncbi:uncharacterized protein LOC134235298 [Saccostrea cucullata]|uniref:uncharacterized protein LOC134235298 n=1 Tax=Saccostrea cuccullata TaxID=36930 RepID=UPI002ED1FD5D